MQKIFMKLIYKEENHGTNIKRTYAHPGQHQDDGELNKLHARMCRNRDRPTGEGLVPVNGQGTPERSSDARQTYQQCNNAMRGGFIMKNIGDKEIAAVLLDEHKLFASSLTNLVLESTNQSLRNDAANLLNRTFLHQKQIFDLMSQKGWYQTQNANQQEISKAQQEVSKVQSSMNM